MTQPKPGEPWAFIAHRDGYWGGVAASTLPKNDLRKFLGDFAADGYAIMTVYNRDEYNAALANLRPFSKRDKPAEAAPAQGAFALSPRMDKGARE